MVRTAVQLHTLENLPETLPETILRIGTTPLEGVEFFDVTVESPTEIADALEESGLEPVGAHVPIGRIEREYEDVIETYETIGCHRLIVPLYDPDAFKSESGVVTAARRLSTLSAKLATDGFDLGYHNHSFEFGPLGGETAYDSFVAGADGVEFELDTGLAAYAGADPEALLSRYGDRISLVHLTDSVPGRESTFQVELGAGELDVEGCVETAREVGVEWLVYEHGQTNDTLGSLTHAATKLPMLSHGRDVFERTKSISTIIEDVNSIAK